MLLPTSMTGRSDRAVARRMATPLAFVGALPRLSALMCSGEKLSDTENEGLIMLRSPAMSITRTSPREKKTPSARADVSDIHCDCEALVWPSLTAKELIGLRPNPLPNICTPCVPSSTLATVLTVGRSPVIAPTRLAALLPTLNTTRFEVPRNRLGYPARRSIDVEEIQSVFPVLVPSTRIRPDILLSPKYPYKTVCEGDTESTLLRDAVINIESNETAFVREEICWLAVTMN
eukprot:1529889-Rhodomonas_salina.1